MYVPQNQQITSEDMLNIAAAVPTEAHLEEGIAPARIEDLGVAAAVPPGQLWYTY